MIRLAASWVKKLAVQPETGMGYQVATVVLKIGNRHEQVVIDSGVVTRV